MFSTPTALVKNLGSRRPDWRQPANPRYPPWRCPAAETAPNSGRATSRSRQVFANRRWARARATFLDGRRGAKRFFFFLFSFFFFSPTSKRAPLDLRAGPRKGADGCVWVVKARLRRMAPAASQKNALCSNAAAERRIDHCSPCCLNHLPGVPKTESRGAANQRPRRQKPSLGVNRSLPGGRGGFYTIHPARVKDGNPPQAKNIIYHTYACDVPQKPNPIS